MGYLEQLSKHYIKPSCPYLDLEGNDSEHTCSDSTNA